MKIKITMMILSLLAGSQMAFGDRVAVCDFTVSDQNTGLVTAHHRFLYNQNCLKQKTNLLDRCSREKLSHVEKIAPQDSVVTFTIGLVYPVRTFKIEEVSKCGSPSSMD